MKGIICCLLLAFSLQSYAQQSKLYAAKNEQGIYIEHKVQPKENWYSVGRIYAISPKDIAAFNGITMDKGLIIGQLLKVPLNATNFVQTVAAVGTPVYYTVQPKEGLLKVASAYGLSLTDIKSLNGLNSDQINVGSQIIVGYIAASNQSGSSTNVSVSSPSNTSYTNSVSTKLSSPASPTTTVKSQSAEATSQVVNTTVQKTPPVTTVIQQPEVVTEKTKESAKPAAKPVEKVEQPKLSVTEVKPSATSANNYFASGFNQQAKEGKEQKLDNPTYGIFKSSSGWQDGKYYMLMNDVIPGTIVKLTATDTGKTIHAKVLGAVPPGKESDGMLLRVSNAAAAALGVETSGVLSLVWYK